MANSMSLALVLSAKSQELAAGLNKGKSLIGDFASNANRQLAKVGTGAGGGLASNLAGMHKSLTGAFSSGPGAFIADLAKQAVGLAADAEAARAPFEFLLKDAAKGRKLFEDLRDVGIRSPLDPKETIAAGRQLLALGMTADDVRNRVRQLTDVASATGGSLGSLAGAFAKVHTQGRLTAESIEAFTAAGVDLQGLLSRSLGISLADVQARLKAGSIDAAAFKQALENATAAGGDFHGASEQMAGGMNVLFKQLEAAKNIALEGIGESLVDTFRLKELLADGNALADAVKGWAKPIMDASNALNPVVGQITMMLDTALAIGDVAGALSKEFAAELKPIADAAQELYKTLTDLFGEIPSWREMTIGSLQVIALGLSYLIDSVKLVAAGLEAASDPSKLDGLVRAWQDFGDTADRVNRAFDGIGKTAEKNAQAVKQMAESSARDLGAVKGQFDAIAKASMGSVSATQALALKVEAMALRLKASGDVALFKPGMALDDIDVMVKKFGHLEAQLAAAKITLPALQKELDTFGGKLTAEAVKKLKDQIAAEQQQIETLKKSLLVNAEAIKTFEELKAARDKALDARAFEVLAGALTPMQKARAELAELQDMLTRGKIDSNAFSVAAARIAEDLFKIGEAGKEVKEALELSLPQAMLEGTAEAVSAVNRFRAAMETPGVQAQQRQETQRDVAEVLKRIDEKARLQLEEQRRMVDALRQQGLIKVK